MPTATLHIAEVGGYAGPARCYRLDPPARINGADHEYATLWIGREYAHQNAKVNIVPATETGACALLSLREAGGSITLHDEPDTPEYIEGVYWLALQGLGGYDIAEAV